MWAVPNWRPWVHLHSSFYFFKFYFPFPPLLTCPQRHVFPSTMRSQSIPLMYSMHAIMFQMEGEGYWMCSSESIWLWPEMGEGRLRGASRASGRRASSSWFTRLQHHLLRQGYFHRQPKSFSALSADKLAEVGAILKEVMHFLPLDTFTNKIT